jgi:hypothetical protein
MSAAASFPNPFSKHPGLLFSINGESNENAWAGEFIVIVGRV